MEFSPVFHFYFSAFDVCVGVKGSSFYFRISFFHVKAACGDGDGVGPCLKGCFVFSAVFQFHLYAAALDGDVCFCRDGFFCRDGGRGEAEGVDPVFQHAGVDVYLVFGFVSCDSFFIGLNGLASRCLRGIEVLSLSVCIFVGDVSYSQAGCGCRESFGDFHFACEVSPSVFVIRVVELIG